MLEVNKDGGICGVGGRDGKGSNNGAGGGDDNGGSGCGGVSLIMSTIVMVVL